MRFHKYQALGNDYIVLDGVAAADLAAGMVERICDRHFGIGSDGILLPVSPEGDADFGLRIFNPDGSEAEKSGNGLRIFARYLWDQGRVKERPFEVTTAGGVVRCRVIDGGRNVFVEMGKAGFNSEIIPVRGPAREVVDESIEVGGATLRFTGVTVGNPHCVVVADEVSRDVALRLGPLLERHDLFPNRTNVQFMRPMDRHRIRIEIWERGAGYTLASGSSSCAAAAAAVRLGLCDDPVTVVMPGGELRIGIGAEYDVTMLGAVAKVAEGLLSREMFDDSPGTEG